jgi:chromosomal replication initiation ATPase DnaA
VANWLKRHKIKPKDILLVIAAYRNFNAHYVQKAVQAKIQECVPRMDERMHLLVMSNQELDKFYTPTFINRPQFLASLTEPRALPTDAIEYRAGKEVDLSTLEPVYTLDMAKRT